MSEPQLNRELLDRLPAPVKAAVEVDFALCKYAESAGRGMARSVVPHMLRDLADGVESGAVPLGWYEFTERRQDSPYSGRVLA